MLIVFGLDLRAGFWVLVASVPILCILFIHRVIMVKHCGHSCTFSFDLLHSHR